MKTIRNIVIVFLLFLFPTISFAWTYTAHVLIAQIAYNNLTPAAKQKAEKLAQDIYVKLPLRQQEQLDTRYATANIFAKVAMLPDVWRKWRLETVFERLDAPLPTNLQPYEDHNTQQWHYITNPYPSGVHCQTVQPQNVVWAINTLRPDLTASKNFQTQAVLMVLLEHYIGDADQPMHTVSNVSESCQGDKGGNDYCLHESSSDRCTKTLHALWDSGVGYIKPKMNIAQAAYQLERAYPINRYSGLIQENPQSWVNAAEHYAAFAYSTPEYHKPSPTYYREGQAVAKQQIALAGYRLAFLLNHVWLAP